MQFRRAYQQYTQTFLKAFGIGLVTSAALLSSSVLAQDASASEENPKYISVVAFRPILGEGVTEEEITASSAEALPVFCGAVADGAKGFSCAGVDLATYDGVIRATGKNPDPAVAKDAADFCNDDCRANAFTELSSQYGFIGEWKQEGKVGTKTEKHTVTFTLYAAPDSEGKGAKKIATKTVSGQTVEKVMNTAQKQAVSLLKSNVKSAKKASKKGK